MGTSLHTHARAIRYRQLALRETDRSRVALLNLLADEAERGVLIVSDRSSWVRADGLTTDLPFQDWIKDLPNLTR
jgi:hypothetical protein